MDAGASRRIALAAAVTAGAVATVVALITVAEPASSRAPGDELLPDLKVERPDELYLVQHKKIRLRVSNTVANIGVGPLEMSGDGSTCDDGDGRRTLQRVFKDSPPFNGYFIRGEDTDAPVEYDAGCSRYHKRHNHWHFDNFARYTLLREKTGKLIDRSRKVSFCVIDTGQPYPGLPGSPTSGYYPREEPPSGPASCSKTSTDGLSIGWEDTYGATLPGQVIDVTRARRGRYCLVLEVDPPTETDSEGQLRESDDENNARTIKLYLRPHRGKAKRLGSDCRAA